jgi:energy-coupling factor transport system ATP-binding protein
VDCKIKGEKMKQPFIKIEKLRFCYGEEQEKTEVLHGVDLEINEGEFVCILGHNGSGKSTLAKHLNGILIGESGDVVVGGINTRDEEKIFDIRSRVGMVFQNPDNQIVATIVEEDVAFALENLGVDPDEIRKRVDEALKTVGMYERRLDEPHKLSGGQKQRVAIAGVLAMHPKCIVLDEPTAMLDPKGRQQVMNTIVRLAREEGITVVLITHFMDEAALCDRIVVMNHGEVIMDDAPKAVFSRADELKEIGLSVPAVTELCLLLRQNGVDIPTNLTKEEEILNALREILA